MIAYHVPRLKIMLKSIIKKVYAKLLIRSKKNMSPLISSRAYQDRGKETKKKERSKKREEGKKDR